MTGIQIENLQKVYPLGKTEVRALNGINLQIEAGEFTAVCGPSGSGKSTLMNIIGCIDAPTAGSVTFNGQRLNYNSLAALSGFRLNNMGFIFQSFNLVPVLSAYENIEYPLLLTNLTARERHQRVSGLIEKTGLAPYARHRPNELSGGQKQRVAIGNDFSRFCAF